ncbi:MAG: CPBP family intramembrane metalloprotease [Chitinophagales bacterium]|nr:CPBP family intramembrane metalloprotease [Chitinophagales bacterium]MDW8418022.1 CPBP family intramembrane glutamic endopeptidase [Chitinophagales bacterium]
MLSHARRKMLYLSWLTLFGMSAMGILLIKYLQQKSVTEVALHGKPYLLQITVGLFFGSLTTLVAVAFIQGKRFRAVREFFVQIIGDLNPGLSEILIYSVCAGVGEEILFRAGIQPLIGVWPAALLFVLLHGYIHPYNFNLTLYGFFLVVISGGFGYLFKFFGLWSAVTAHIVYDVAMFSLLRYSSRVNNSTND